MTTTWAITTWKGWGNRLHLVLDDGTWAACGRRRRYHGPMEDRSRGLRCLTALMHDLNADGSSAELAATTSPCPARGRPGWLDLTGDRLQSAVCLHEVRMESDVG